MSRYTAFPRPLPFNRDCEFTVRRGIRLNGQEFKDGDVIDKTLLTTRRLRQLFEQRFIVQGDSVPNTLVVPHSIDFKQLPTAAIVSWLAQRQKTPRPGSDRAKTIALAEIVQRKEKEAEDGVVSGNPVKERDPQRLPRKVAKRDSAQSDAQQHS